MKLKSIFVLIVIAMLVTACGKVPAPTAVNAPAPTAALPTEAPYAPVIDPANFVAVVDNPYLPRIPGTKYVYEGMTADGLKRNESEVLSETRLVMEIQATVVSNQAYLNGELTEDNRDWFAQDKEGNVWYLGEEVVNYENGVLKDHAGSWEAGVDGALPGIVMLGNPAGHIGEIYRQEHYVGATKDKAEVLSISEHVTIPYGSFDNVLETHDTSDAELDLNEHKFYAAGIGLIKTVDLTAAAEFVLVEFIPAETSAELLPQPTSGFPPGFVPNETARVDIVKPVFTNPTSITNPLLPITEVDQLIQLGLKDGHPHRTEFTLLPSTKTITWNGEQTETRVLQFVAYLDGRVLEHALDFLAQADTGAVWYFGEDVYNYENGVVVDRDGTWLAGKDGPPAMIMPANPQVGNIYRVENIPGNVFEEVT
ncbi:MAG: hypothetical protein L0Z71_11675, partial [Anaerolineae bacterium]|nr:hypothetical protein [Anaerolineae bacterium]